MTEIQLTVPDIHCDHCKTALEGAVGDLQGVSHAEVAVVDRVLSVTFDAPAELDDIVAAVESQGYFVAS